MRTTSFTFLSLMSWLLMVVLGGIFLQPDGGSGMQEDSAWPLIEASDPLLQREGGRLLLDATLVTGILVTRSADHITWTPFVDGRRHGREIARYADGARMLDRIWKDGLREGETRMWWPDGTLQEMSTYENDVLEGESKRWFADSQQASVFQYSKGQEDGPQRMWYEDGTLRANYVVVDGRRYGSNGTKGCTSTQDNDE